LHLFVLMSGFGLDESANMVYSPLFVLMSHRDNVILSVLECLWLQGQKGNVPSSSSATLV